MGYNTACLRVFYNYADVKNWHDETPPIRGNNDKVRPLGSRRHWNMASISMDGDDVVFNYYGHKAVVWHPDDSLTVYYPTYCTAYEPDKMAHFLPPLVNYEWNARRLVVHNHWDNTRVVVTPDKPLHLKCVGVADWNGRVVRKFETQDVPVTYRYVKRRGAVSKIIKQKFQPFLDWVELTLPFTPRVMSPEHVKAHNALFYQVTGCTAQDWEAASNWYNNAIWGKDSATDERKYAFNQTFHAKDTFPVGGRNNYRGEGVHIGGALSMYELMLPENQDSWLTALQIIAGHHCTRRWNSGDVYYEVNIKHVREYVERIVCVTCKGDVFDKQQLERGTVPSKLHTRLFKELKFPYFEKTDSVSDISV